MAKVTLLFALLMMALGLVGYLGSGHQHPTALIPFWWGLALGIFGILAISPKESRRKLFMHVNVTIGLLGFIGGLVEGIRGYGEADAGHVPGLSGGGEAVHGGADADLCASLRALVHQARRQPAAG